MKIKMNKLAAGPEGAYEEGRIYDVDQQLGQAFVEAGGAVDCNAVVEAHQPEEPSAFTLAALKDAIKAKNLKETAEALALQGLILENPKGADEIPEETFNAVVEAHQSEVA